MISKIDNQFSLMTTKNHSLIKTKILIALLVKYLNPKLIKTKKVIIFLKT
jgi:hypothetical protein